MNNPSPSLIGCESRTRNIDRRERRNEREAGASHLQEMSPVKPIPSINVRPNTDFLSTDDCAEYAKSTP